MQLLSAMLSKRKSYLGSQLHIQRAGTPLGKWPCLLGAAFPELRQSSGVVAWRYGGFESPEHFTACIAQLWSTPAGLPRQQQLSRELEAWYKLFPPRPHDYSVPFLIKQKEFIGGCDQLSTGRSWTLPCMQVCFCQVQAGPNRTDNRAWRCNKVLLSGDVFVPHNVGNEVPVLAFHQCAKKSEKNTLEMGNLVMAHGFRCFSPWSLWQHSVQGKGSGFHRGRESMETSLRSQAPSDATFSWCHLLKEPC